MSESEFAATFSGFVTVLQGIAIVSLVAIILESVFDLIYKKRRFAETLANFAIAIVNHLLEKSFYGSIFLIGLFIVGTAIPWHIAISWHTWILAVIAADFSYYWMHRVEHEVRILWTFHSVHHSSPEFNLSTSMRLAWIEPVVEWGFFIPMVLIGFDVIQTLIALLIVVSYQTWIHTERVGSLGWIDTIFNTPSLHRVHHACNAHYLDKNYGGILIIWDRVFGTYQTEDAPVNYGLTTPLGSSNPLTINTYELLQFIKDAQHRSIGNALRYAFGRPGWCPQNNKLIETATNTHPRKHQ